MKTQKIIKKIFTIVIILTIIIMPIKSFATPDTVAPGFSIDGFMGDAKNFITEGSKEGQDLIDQGGIKTISDVIYNTLFAVGMVAAVATGIFLGIKLMLGSVEEQAQYKTLLVPYFIGCVVIFGAFGIWKLVVTILQSSM